MTVIVGVASDNEIYIGADRLQVSEWEGRVGESKLIVQSHGIVGVTSTASAICELRSIPLPSPNTEPTANNLYDYYVKSVKKSADLDKSVGIALLIVWGNKLWEVDGNLYVHEVSKYTAVGLGRQVALGAMYGRERTRGTALGAMHAAAHFLIGVRGPFDLITVTPSSVVQEVYA